MTVLCKVRQLAYRTQSNVYIYDKNSVNSGNLSVTVLCKVRQLAYRTQAKLYIYDKIQLIQETKVRQLIFSPLVSFL